MNEFEDLLNSVSQVEPGDVVTAEVLTVDANQANVAISGTGVEGVLTLRELTNDRDADINDLVKPGETLELLVLRQVVGKDTDTVTYLVSKKRLEARKAWDKLVGREEEVVTVKGTRAVKGGLSVEFEGLRGFIPASMLDTRFVRNTERFVGQEFDAKIKEVDPKENRFILSRREVVEAESAAARAEVFGKLNVGDVVTKLGDGTKAPTIKSIDTTNDDYDTITLSAAYTGLAEKDVIVESNEITSEVTEAKPLYTPNMVVGADLEFTGKGIPTIDAAFEAVVLYPSLNFPIIPDWLTGCCLKANHNILFIKQ